MAEHLKISKSRKKNIVKIPAGFLDYYLPTVNGDYLKIYLYGLRLCYNNESLTDEEIAQKLGFLKADIVNAWSFWEQEGLVFVHQDGTVEFENIEELTFLQGNIRKKRKNENEFKDIFGTISKDSEFQRSVRTIEALYKELLTQNDVLALYDVLHTQKIPLELYIIAMTHCIEMNKKSIPYITKVVTSCCKKGISTAEALESYFSKNDEENKYIRKIKKILKIYNRELIDKEKNFILKWEAMKKTDDEIKEAYEKTVMNTGKLSFPYMDKVLSADTNSENQKKAAYSPNQVKPGPLNNFSSGTMPDFSKLTEQFIKKQNSDDELFLSIKGD